MVPFWPSVTLSPYARYFVTPSTGTGGVSVTLNEQVACRAAASVAMQVTGVVPRPNVEPEPGVHDTAIGAAPPVDVGAGKATGCDGPVTPGTDTFAGQDTRSVSTVGLG